jgi:hypothetical protein
MNGGDAGGTRRLGSRRRIARAGSSAPVLACVLMATYYGLAYIRLA